MADFGTLVAVVFFVFFSAWIGVITFIVMRLKKHYNRLVTSHSKKGLQEIIEEILLQSKQNQESIKKILNSQQEQQKQLDKAIQFTSIIRYNPFRNTGGDQSFIVGLLDKHKSGIIISSLSNRSVTRWFAKPVKLGKGLEVPLTKEEEQAVEQTKHEK